MQGVACLWDLEGRVDHEENVEDEDADDLDDVSASKNSGQG